MTRITTGKDKIPKNSILARIFGLRQGFKDKSCPGQEIGETRTQYHPWFSGHNKAINGKIVPVVKQPLPLQRFPVNYHKSVTSSIVEIIPVNYFDNKHSTSN